MKHTLQTVEEQPDEKRLLLVRRHWFLFSRRLTLFFLLACLPPLLVLFAVPNGMSAFRERTPGSVLLVIGFSLFYLYLLLFLLHAWMNYFLDVWIVSTKRIVNIVQDGLFSRTVSELILDDIQDVTVQVHGVFPTMLRYGDVYIQTAGENPRFHFDDVPNPYKIAEQVMELHRTSQATPQTPPPAQSGDTTLLKT